MTDSRLTEISAEDHRKKVKRRVNTYKSLAKITLLRVHFFVTSI